MADYATLLRDQVTLTCRSVDRIFLQGYVPKLQSVGLVCNFLRWQRGFPIPSSAAFGKIGDAYVKDIHRFAETHAVPVVHFAQGENKEAFARKLIDNAAAAEGGDGKVVLIGIAQEKASVWRWWPTKGQEKHPHPHMEWGRQMAFVRVLRWRPGPSRARICSAEHIRASVPGRVMWRAGARLLSLRVTAARRGHITQRCRSAWASSSL